MFTLGHIYGHKWNVGGLFPHYLKWSLLCLLNSLSFWLNECSWICLTIVKVILLNSPAYSTRCSVLGQCLNLILLSERNWVRRWQKTMVNIRASWILWFPIRKMRANHHFGAFNQVTCQVNEVVSILMIDTSLSLSLSLCLFLFLSLSVDKRKSPSSGKVLASSFGDIKECVWCAFTESTAFIRR